MYFNPLQLRGSLTWPTPSPVFPDGTTDPILFVRLHNFFSFMNPLTFLLIFTNLIFTHSWEVSVTIFTALTVFFPLIFKKGTVKSADN